MRVPVTIENLEERAQQLQERLTGRFFAFATTKTWTDGREYEDRAKHLHLAEEEDFPAMFFTHNGRPLGEIHLCVRDAWARHWLVITPCSRYRETHITFDDWRTIQIESHHPGGTFSWPDGKSEVLPGALEVYTFIFEQPIENRPCPEALLCKALVSVG